MNLRAWLKEFRILFLLFVALPVVLGSAIAYAYEPAMFSLFYAILSVIAMLSLHAGTVLLNDYFDFKSGTDVVNTERTPYSGGSGLLPEKVLSPKQVAAAGLACFALSIVLGLYIVFTRSSVVFALGVIGIAIGFFYTAPPFKLAYRGLGEMARFIATPLVVFGAFLVQVPLYPSDIGGHLWATAVVVVSSLPLAFLNTAALYIFQFPDHKADSATGKNNLVVRLSGKNAVYLFIALNALAYLSLLAGIVSGLLTYLAGVALVALPLSTLACVGLVREHDRPKQLVPYLKAASDAYVLAAAALTLAFIF